jgi:tryptophan-rich sensory protein
MVFGVELWAAGIAAGVAIVMAVLGTVIAGDGLKSWYPGLRHPRFEPPVWGFALIGAVVYVLDVVILYRLLTGSGGAEAGLGIIGLLVVMLANELWNAVLFRWRNLDAALVSLLGFAGLVAVLAFILFRTDALSGWLMVAYLAWVVAFDVPWIVRLRELNRAGC